MNTFLLILSIMFLFAGIFGGISEQDFGMMFMGIVVGVALLIWRASRIKNAPLIEQKKDEQKKKKEEQYRYKYYLTDEGKKVLMEYVSEYELETYSWETIAKNYASEQGQKVLQNLARERTEAEIEESEEE